MIKAILIPTDNVEEAWNLVDKHIHLALERSGIKHERNREPRKTI